VSARPTLLLFALAGCEGVLPGVDLQQMNQQHKFGPYQACAFFPDGRAMQVPPEGSVPRDAILAPALARGIVDGAYVAEVPLPLSRALLDSGRFGFDTYCAACHGLDGSGQSEVARNMDLRRPPPLSSGPVRDFPAGRIFQVATEGYGLMPSFAIELGLKERWAVVAYLQALQLSQAIALDRLPPDLAAAARAALAARKGEP
jgi:hypothetical protein